MSFATAPASGKSKGKSNRTPRRASFLRANLLTNAAQREPIIAAKSDFDRILFYLRDTYHDWHNVITVRGEFGKLTRCKIGVQHFQTLLKYYMTIEMIERITKFYESLAPDVLKKFLQATNLPMLNLHVYSIKEQYNLDSDYKHKKQLAAVKEKPTYQVADTAFSSITINRNFRTALHMDDGDFREGFGNLSVIERGKYSGGATIFPRYKIGFNVRTGDFLAMDVHEWHCNTEMYESPEDKKYNKALPKIHHDAIETGTMGGEKPFTRISFVCYLREKLRGCKIKETQEYYKRIQFHPERGDLKKGTTRKA